MAEGAGGAALDVLLVEDEMALAVMYRIKLSAAGHVVRIAHDGPTGLREALERPPDVLLLDIGLPGFDGLALLARLREDARGERVPVIVLSNYGEPEVVARGAELGALGHLIKAQTTPASLAQTIGELIVGSAAGLAGT